MRKAIIATAILVFSNLSYAGNDALKSKIMSKLQTRSSQSAHPTTDRLVLLYGGKDITNTQVASAEVEYSDHYSFVESVSV